MSDKNNRIENIFSVVVVIISLLILYGFTVGNTPIFYFLIIANFVCGPICLVLYLIEIKRGVFRVEEDEE